MTVTDRTKYALRALCRLLSTNLKSNVFFARSNSNTQSFQYNVKFVVLRYPVTEKKKEKNTGKGAHFSIRSIYENINFTMQTLELRNHREKSKQTFLFVT